MWTLTSGRYWPAVEELVHAVISRIAVSATIEHLRGAPPVVTTPCRGEVARRRRADARAGAPTPTLQSLGGEDFAWTAGGSRGYGRAGDGDPRWQTCELHQGRSGRG